MGTTRCRTPHFHNVPQSLPPSHRITGAPPSPVATPCRPVMDEFASQSSASDPTTFLPPQRLNLELLPTTPSSQSSDCDRASTGLSMPPPYSTRCPSLASFACLVYILSEVEALGLCFPVQDVSSQGLRFPCSNSLASCIVKL
jgi:hypothetical protein